MCFRRSRDVSTRPARTTSASGQSARVSYRTQATVPTDSPAALRTLYPAQRASFSPSERVIIATSATRERVPERQGDPRRTSTAETVRRGRCHLAATLLDPSSLPDGESPCGAVEPGRRTAG